MTYTPGENSQYQWKTMEGVPERVGTCRKLRQGQLLMQRYQFVFNLGHMTRYQAQADRCKERARILAARMVEHSSVCNLCCKEKVLEDPVYYGVFK